MFLDITHTIPIFILKYILETVFDLRPQGKKPITLGLTDNASSSLLKPEISQTRVKTPADVKII